MDIDEAIKILNYQIKMKDTDVYTPINYDAIETIINEYNNLKQIEEAHRIENGKLRARIKQLEDIDNHIPRID